MSNMSRHILNTLHRMSKVYLKRVYFKIPSIDECRCSKVPQMSYEMSKCSHHGSVHSPFHMTSEALLSICTYQYLEFPCQMGDARAKSAFITIVSISESILWGVMQAVLVHDLDIWDYPLTPVLVVLTVGIFAMPESTYAL